MSALTREIFNCMDTQKEKIKFYLDKNIWSHKIIEMSPSELEEFKNLLKPLKKESKIEIYYSPVNVLELIKGLQLEKYYEVCQKEIRLADRITEKHILEYPWHHTQRIAFWFLGQQFPEVDLTFLNLCRKIANSSYRDIEHNIQPIHNILNRWINKWVDDLNSIKLGFREKLGLENIDESNLLKIKEYWTKESAPKRRQRMWTSFCDHFYLLPQLKDFPFISAYNNFHSFRYWVDYRLTFENKLIFENKRVKPGDYLDWEQTVYLNIMDCLVTEDRDLRSIFEECENDEMHSKAITFNKFIEYLEGKLPSKQAPDTTTEQWYDAE